MATINTIKQQAQTDSPILLFDCVLSSGETQRWCTHQVLYDQAVYAARVLKHNLFDLQLSSDDAMDGISNLSVTLGNADSTLSQIEQAIGFKGAMLTVQFGFFDLTTGQSTTETNVLFRGVAGDPDEITESTFRLTFTNKLSLQRIPIPETRIQRNCPWNFPGTAAQRAEAVSGGVNGRFSRFYRCGYSAGVAGGVGNLGSNGQPYTTCDGSRTQCVQRGMFSADSAGNVTKRFGGVEFVPSSIMVRTHGDKTSHLSSVLDNTAKYNDPAPLVYGTGWLRAPLVLSRNDGNLTHMEVMLGLGVVQNVLKVVVNDVEIPVGTGAANLATTGWYQIVTTGARSGAFNMDFTDGNGNALGDPYGSLCVLSIVVPNRISAGTAVPVIEILFQGVALDTYNADSSFATTAFSNNPAWVILDLLKRSGWSTSDMNLASFYEAAMFCQEAISATDLNGNSVSIPRYACNLVINKRQSAAQIIRGIRTASSLMLRYGSNGLLELLPETTLQRQQATPMDGSNSVEVLNGGWPAYEFSDASGPFSGIARRSDGSSSVRLSARTTAETSNRLSVEFQDEWNEYQQDSLSVSDADDAALIGYEISSASTALGLTNMSQATRVLLRQLDKGIAGNQFIELQTTFRGLKIRPGDLIAITYEKEGLVRTPFRVIKLSPAANYQMVTILAQIHDDDWYSDDISVLSSAGRQPGSSDVPRPLMGVVAHSGGDGCFEYFDFNITDVPQSNPDGTAVDTVTVAFVAPSILSSGTLSLPLLSLSPTITSAGGTLAGNKTLYYAVTACDSLGREGQLSFTVAATVPATTNTNTVTIGGLSFPSSATTFNVYRGHSPQLLYRIATNVTLSSSFTDTGLAAQPAGPPDPAFDHANFYYRAEYGGPWVTTSASSTTIVCNDMGAVPLAYAGMLVRISDGKGLGQERTVATNDASTLTVTPAWTTVPDTTSTFVVVEPSWHFAAVGSTSPMQFQIPYRSGTVIEITGRGANARNVEGSADLCPITRFALGGGKADVGTSPAPLFTLTAAGDGTITLAQVGFSDLTNTGSITSGTLQVFGWNEVAPVSAGTLSSAVSANATTLPIQNIGSPYVGQLVQVDTEIMTVLSVSQSSSSYVVQRGSMGSTAAAHSAGAQVTDLITTTVVIPFARGMFANRSSVNFQQVTAMPDMRIAAAQFYVTNAFGDSQAALQYYTTAPGGGLRTLSGGQFAIQVSGPVATQNNAAPPLLVQQSHAVRDIRATLSQAPAGYSIQLTLSQAGQAYASFTVADGQTVSAVLDGSTLPYLAEGSSLTLAVALTPTPNYQGVSSPGRDLTVTVRL